MKAFRKIIDIFSSEWMLFLFACAYMLMGFGYICAITCGNAYMNLFCNIVKVWGGVIIVACLFDRSKWKLDARLILLILFIVSYLSSCWVTSAFGGLWNNIKGVAWIIIQAILLAGLLNKGLNSKWLHRLFVVYVSIATVFAFVSLLFLLIGFIYVPTTTGGDTMWMGLCTGRLYGLYKDPNYGAISSCICLFLIAFMLIRRRSRWRIVGAIFLSLPQLFYIVFTGSRTALVSLLVSVFVFVAVIVFKYARDKKAKTWKQILCGVLSAGCSCCLLIGVFFVLPSAFDKLAPIWYSTQDGTISDTLLIFPRQLTNDVNNSLDIAQINTEDQQNALKGTNKDADANVCSTSLVEEISAPSTDNSENATARESELNSNNSANNAAQNKDSSTINDTSSKVDSSHTGLLARSEEGDVSNNRFDLWKTAINIWWTSPFIGVSHYNILEYAKAMFPDSRYVTLGQVTSHNAYLDVLAAQGIIGLGIFVALIIITLIGFARLIIRHHGKHAYKLCALLGFFVILLTSACFYPELIYLNTLDALFFWLIMSIVRSEEYLV